MNVFNELLETIEKSSINNKASIENVELFVKSWQKENDLQLHKTLVMRSPYFFVLIFSKLETI